MTSLRTTSLSAAAAVGLASLACATPPSVHAAELISTPASMCKPYGSDTLSAQLALNRQAARLANSDTTNNYAVICPVIRYSDGGPATVYVDGAVDNGATVDCTLYSYDYNGRFLASRSFSESGPGYTRSFDNGLTLSEAEAPHYAFLSTVCWLPPQLKGRLHGVLSYK
jgi:hypothetical protein